MKYLDEFVDGVDVVVGAFVDVVVGAFVAVVAVHGAFAFAAVGNFEDTGIADQSTPNHFLLALVLESDFSPL